MVRVLDANEHVEIEMTGWDVMWSFRKRIRFRKDQVVRVYQDSLESQTVQGIRCPGTYWPGLIIAGTYYYRRRKFFWMVRKPEQAVIFELNQAEFYKVIVQVADPSKVVQEWGRWV
jgi:hypothetical protein